MFSSILPLHKWIGARIPKNFYNDHCIYLFPMLGWFLFSGLLSSYNKYVFGDEHMAFPCPLMLTSIHFAIQFLFSYSVTKTFPHIFGGDEVDNMPWETYLWVCVPCGMITALDVGFSNLALVYITISFYTMVKASAPIFVVISAYLFGIEKITAPLILVVLIISSGELLTVLGEVDFNALGFTYGMIASVLSGMRWTVVQLQIQKLDPPLKTPITTMRVLSPVMFLSMCMLSIISEQPWNKFKGTDYMDSFEDASKTIGLGVLGALLAICMLTCEFHLIMKSSAVILMIGGVLKELTTIFIG